MKTTFEQPPVSRVVWPWTQEDVINKREGMPGPLGIILPLIIASTIAFLFYKFKPEHAALPWVIMGIATFVTLNALFFPAGHRAIQKVFMGLAVWVNYILTRLLLVPLYILVFAVGHFFMKIRGKDPMDRTLDPDASTYWIDRDKNTDKETYRNQY